MVHVAYSSFSIVNEDMTLETLGSIPGTQIKHCFVTCTPSDIWYMFLFRCEPPALHKYYNIECYTLPFNHLVHCVPFFILWDFFCVVAFHKDKCFHSPQAVSNWFTANALCHTLNIRKWLIAIKYLVKARLLCVFPLSPYVEIKNLNVCECCSESKWRSLSLLCSVYSLKPHRQFHKRFQSRIAIKACRKIYCYRFTKLFDERASKRISTKTRSLKHIQSIGSEPTLLYVVCPQTGNGFGWTPDLISPATGF